MDLDFRIPAAKPSCMFFNALGTQAAAVILECVVETQASVEAMQCLKAFAGQAGYVLHQVRLELSDQWCTRRHRWWGVLLPSHLPQPSPPSWPEASPTLTVGSVIPEWPIWEPDADSQLLWTEAERQAYTDPMLGTKPRVLNVAGKAPTTLHSYGNPLQGCPCKCRAQGFSMHRLGSQGLRGFGVPAHHFASNRYLPAGARPLKHSADDHAACSRTSCSSLSDWTVGCPVAVLVDEWSVGSLGLRALSDAL